MREYPIKIWPETWPGKISYVLEQEGSRLGFPHRANSLRPHVTAILLAQLLSANPKRLTGGTARDRIQSVKRAPVDFPNILELHRPGTDMFNAISLVVQNGRHRVPVEFSHVAMLESSSGHTQGQPAASGEEFSAFHPRPFPARAGASAPQRLLPNNARPRDGRARRPSHPAPSQGDQAQPSASWSKSW